MKTAIAILVLCTAAALAQAHGKPISADSAVHPIAQAPDATPTLSIATNTALGTLEQQKRQLRQQISQIEQQIQQVQQQEVAVEGEFNRDHAGWHIDPATFEVKKDQTPPKKP